MGLTWGWQEPGGPRVGPVNLAICVFLGFAVYISIAGSPSPTVLIPGPGLVAAFHIWISATCVLRHPQHDHKSSPTEQETSRNPVTQASESTEQLP